MPKKKKNKKASKRFPSRPCKHKFTFAKEDLSIVLMGKYFHSQFVSTRASCSTHYPFFPPLKFSVFSSLKIEKLYVSTVEWLIKEKMEEIRMLINM